MAGAVRVGNQAAPAFVRRGSDHQGGTEMAEGQGEPTGRGAGDDGGEPTASYLTDGATGGGSARSRAPWLAAVAGLVAVALVGGAVLVSSDDGGPPVLSVTPGGGFESVGSALSDAGVSASSMAADVEYVLDGDLPDLGDTGTAYRLVRPDLSDGDVVRLAAALGADGSIQRADGTRVVSDDDRSVAVVEADGAWYVSSYEGGTVSGYEGTTETTTAGAPASTVVTTPNGVPVEGSDSGAPVPVPTTPPTTEPVDLPSEAEAEDIARGVLAAAGVEGEWRAEVDDASMTGVACSSDGPCGETTTVVVSLGVTLELLADGIPTGIAWYVQVGDRGTVTSASGTVTELEEVGDYPLRPTTDVYDDLVAGDTWYGGGVQGYAGVATESFASVGSAISADDGCTPEECGVATTEALPSPPVYECTAPDADVCGNVSVCQGDPNDPTSSPGDVPGTAPGSDPVAGSKFCSVAEEPVPVPSPDELVEPMPEPLPEPMPAMVVHVTGAERSLVQVPGVHDGEPVTWLLPAYRFVGTWEVGEPWYADLPAIDEAYVDLPDPEAPATTVPDIGSTDGTADPASTTTMSSDATAPATSAVDPSTTTSGPAAPVQPSTESQQPATGPTTTTTTVG